MCPFTPPWEGQGDALHLLIVFCQTTATEGAEGNNHVAGQVGFSISVVIGET